MTKAQISAKITHVEPSSQPDSFTLRPATPADASIIRHIISRVRNNPLSLDWRRFILAVSSSGEVIGCGQVKPHTNGLLELASIAVLPEWRGQGIARAIIEHLLERYPSRIYLTCRSSLGPLYQKFGFQAIQLAEMPPYYRRISRIVALYSKLFRLPERMLVMRRN